jgi:hypothetical protein
MFEIQKFKAHTVTSPYLQLDGTKVKLRDIQGFQILRVQYLINKWLGPPNHFNRSMIFEISVVEILKFNGITYLAGANSITLQFQECNYQKMYRIICQWYSILAI